MPSRDINRYSYQVYDQLGLLIKMVILVAGRGILDEVWSKPVKVSAILVEAANRNQNVFEFEQALVS